MTPSIPLILALSDATSAPILAVIDKFWIFLAIAIGTIIVEWLKKRHPPGEPGSADETETYRPTTSTRSPSPPSDTRPAGTSDWEEELRRLLGGKPPEAKPPPIRTPEPTSAPPVRPVVIPTPKPVMQLPRTVPPPLAGTVMAEAERNVEVRLPTLKDSATAYQRASHLQEQVIERLKQVEEMTERHQVSVPTAHRQAISTDAVRSIALIRNRTTARQAIIASLIFGPPKALENE